MREEVLVLATAVGVLSSTGEVEVEFHPGGARVLVPGENVLCQRGLWVHRSDCALHSRPAYPPGPCNCGRGIGG